MHRVLLITIITDNCGEFLRISLTERSPICPRPPGTLGVSTTKYKHTQRKREREREREENSFYLKKFIAIVVFSCRLVVLTREVEPAVFSLWGGTNISSQCRCLGHPLHSMELLDRSLVG